GRVALRDRGPAVQGAEPLDGGQTRVGALRRGQSPAAIQGDVDIEARVGVRARDVGLSQLDARQLPGMNERRGVGDAQLSEVGRARRHRRAARDGEHQRQHGGEATEHGRLLDRGRRQATRVSPVVGPESTASGERCRDRSGLPLGRGRSYSLTQPRRLLMARTYNVIDADGHILEPVDIWEKYIDPAYRERAPRMIVDTDGKERLLVEGKILGSPKGLGLIGGLGAPPATVDDVTMKYVEGRPGGFDPHARIPDMDLDGIDAAFLYPSIGLFSGAVQDPGLAAAMCRAYNRWLADYCKPYPDRLFGVAMLPMQ